MKANFSVCKYIISYCYRSCAAQDKKFCELDIKSPVQQHFGVFTGSVCFCVRKVTIILLFFRWLSSLWLNLVIADIKWNPIAFKMGLNSCAKSNTTFEEICRTHSPEGRKARGQPVVRGLANTELMLCLICFVKTVSSSVIWSKRGAILSGGRFWSLYMKNHKL